MKNNTRTIVAVFVLLGANVSHGFLSPYRSKTKLALRSQQQELQEILQQVTVLEESLKDDDTSNFLKIEEQISLLEQQMQQFEQIPIQLTINEFQEACWTILNLPVEVRVALWYAVEETSDDLWEKATDVQQIPTLITKLYEQQHNQAELVTRSQEGLLIARKGRKTKKTLTPATTPTKTKKTPQTFSLFNNNNNSDAEKTIELTPEEQRTESMIQQLLPRVTRQSEVTSQELAVVMEVLRRKDIFLPTSTSPRRIPGGYCISGTWKPNQQSVRERLKRLEEQVPKSFDAQLCWLPDSFSDTDDDDEPFGVTKDPVLLLTKRDFTSSTQPLLNGIASLSAFCTCIVFIVGIYGGNELVMTRLTQPDYSGIDWFNGKIVDLLGPLSLVSGMHLSAQAVVARWEQVKLSFPVVLPFWPLPWMGTLRRCTNSPSSRTSLANVALAGPVAGLVTSAALLWLGLQLTATAPSELSDYFPTLPVRVLQLSMAGGSMIDSVLGGAAGFFTTQESSTAIPLHPLAVAGYVSLLIQAVDLLPLGATNGGRLSLALLGREGHSVIGGLTWLILLLASLSDAQTDVLVGAWIVNNVVQNDPEVPCRNEVDPVGIPQAAAAMFLWFVTALILTPLL
ncbi:hypothetical protein FisN_3Hh543 [Fistulifera solaris]|uniref:Peptidase M50 domain-containing protein n=1 Tax=Fistulifera solaris TaxID=1519565 RepID=A0A1Z5K343_FISSO|nr:hypothetical protein FisN_3Hh543 [Fistulifera solaris]|eukprot:GAX20606.1 hypothetical protein FisN_3Hh543 [Fistulifera solaris]